MRNHFSMSDELRSLRRLSAEALYVCFFLVSPCVQSFAQNALTRFSSDPDLRGAIVSAQLADATTGEVLASANADRRLCPASVWKLFTTGAALEVLGPDFRFKTFLAHDGHIHDRVLQGNVYLVGGGDPALGSRYFGDGFEALMQAWAIAIKQLGIDSVAGKVVVNTAHYSGDVLPPTRIWEDMANYYGTAAWGFNIHDNSYEIHFQTATSVGSPATILKVSPEVPVLTLSSEVYSSDDNSDKAYIFGAPLDNVRVVRGTLPAGRADYAIKGSLPNPPLFAAFHLEKAMLSVGITVGEGIAIESVTDRNPAALKVISEIVSPPLSELSAHINSRSDNLYAEALLLQIGASSGLPTISGGLKALQSHFHSICEQEYPMYGYDGSGLSRFTAVSAAQVVQAILHYQHDELLRQVLLQSLPLAGREGSMKYFGRGGVLDGNLRGKSGSMDKVKAYAGVFNTASGRQVLFAVLVNNFDGEGVSIKKKIEKMLEAVYMEY